MARSVPRLLCYTRRSSCYVWRNLYFPLSTPSKFKIRVRGGNNEKPNVKQWELFTVTPQYDPTIPNRDNKNDVRIRPDERCHLPTDGIEPENGGGRPAQRAVGVG